ncbi:MAG: 30S ribosome-binding factor RbfA [Bacilli bacterium]|jgi:ribosome-binding factor A|nr:30S ribosome-binding factor RbfA [Bacilli bacterium]
MASAKVERIQNLMLRKLSHIIQFEMKDNKLGFISITDVKVTNDLSQATIYVNFLGNDNREQAGLEILNKAKGFIRTRLAHEMEMRKVPELFFKIDTSLEQGNRIENIIKQINNKKED